jgi:pimeloyl-ACP methyl ester carboxylesterase
MAELTHDGATIHSEVSGAGPAILVGPSLMCDADMWRGVAPRLAERHTVINVEVRGHRRSTAPAPFTLEDLGGDWLAILDREGIDRAFLVGLSMGGMTAMRLAMRAPQRVAGMVLIDSNADIEERAKRAQYAAMVAIYKRFGIFGLLARRTASIMLGQTTIATRRHLIDELQETVARHPRDQLPRAIRAVFSRGDLIPRLGEITCPTLVLVGAEDKATPPVKSEHIHAGIAGSRLQVLDGVGHLSALEDPDAVSAPVLAFLAEHRW